MIGESVGHYRITAKLGEGGMGVVYRASDSRLGREVALKVLPASMAEDRERMARFEREARTLAAVNHPNIAAIYGIEAGALVMELVEGQTLDERGGLSADEARQIADALEAAHEKGIIHRDLKPANIKITPGGQIKLLDFGLAKAAEAVAATDVTRTMGTSLAGAVMGTPAYMSPEQARGAAVDHRTDIWAYGVVLYELTTGKKLFGGETVPDILAEVLKGEFSVEAAPEWVKPVLRRCLVRDVKKRLGWIGEARLLLEAPMASQRSTPWALYAAVGALVCLSGFLWWRTPATGPVESLHFSFAPKGMEDSIRDRHVVVSPNGKLLTYVADGKLWVHDLRTGTAKALSGTEGAAGPFWSPDSATVGYWAKFRMWRVGLDGAPPVALGKASEYHGASFTEDGKEIYVAAAKAGILAMPSTGGAGQAILKLTGAQMAALNTSLLPDGGGGPWMVGSRRQRLMAIHVKTGEQRDLGQGEDPVYSTTGHLLYESNGRIVAAPFSLRDAKFTGAPQDVAPNGTEATVSANGTLVYRGRGNTDFRFVIRSRKGEALGFAGAAQKVMQNLELSPDGKRIAVASQEQGSDDVWIHEVGREVKSRLTASEGDEGRPVWSPDGSRIVYSLNRKLFMVPADGTKAPVELPGLEGVPTSWSPDGRTILHFTVFGTAASNDMGYAELGQDGKWTNHELLMGPFDESLGKLSPDGKFMAYVSNESGSYEIYARPFPSGPGKWQISTDGGVQPRWSRDGKELFYLQDGVLMAVPISVAGGAISAGKPEALFATGGLLSQRTVWKYDVMAEGRFVVIERVKAPDDPGGYIHVITNWPALLEKKQ